ncbi:hypothetical protein MLD38_035939 [Melastoma candidum]|uniref:Uncharacterized protein n=1 Tax=Melastoma candidum TaxID=119954 RepID=A0ACB9LIC4_9MYRT|nr:hypothetical protein MLD38_035939 [Melastoma candidum]
MSQEQPIRYGDVFPELHGELAEMLVTPREAAMMQTAETTMLGRTTRGGAAAIMQSAAARNEKAGLVAPGDLNSVAVEGGVTVTETDLPGRRVITESIGGQIVGQFSQRAPLHMMTPATIYQQDNGKSGGLITIGEALEAAILTVGQKPVEWSDAAAIQAAEVRATGRTSIIPGGVAASAQSAAEFNSKTQKHEEKTKLADVLMNAASRLPSDKPATRRDAEGVSGAEMRNDPYLTPHPAGVAASVAAAARINREK